MIFAIGKTATLRNGAFIPGGKKFEVSATEVESLRSSGYEIVEESVADSQELPSINNTPESETLGIPENFGGEFPGDSFQKKFLGQSAVEGENIPRMGGSRTKATSKVKVGTAKEAKG